MNALVMLPTGDTLTLSTFQGEVADIQGEVGGIFDPIGVRLDTVMFVNREQDGGVNARASAIAHREIRGTAVLAGMDGSEELVDLPGDMLLAAMAVLPTGS